MFKTKVGYSTNLDPFQAGAETALTVTKENSCKAGIIFANADMDVQKVLEGVKSVFGNKPVIGCTSSGGIVVPDGFITGDAYCGMMSFAGDDLIMGAAGYEKGKETARELGKKIAREAITNAGIKKVPSYFYMVASPKEEEEYLKGIQDVIGNVPFFGGSAADNTIEGKWSIFCNDKVFRDGCAVLFFYAKNECKSVFTGAYEETKNAGVITKINGKRILSEIDGEPALKKYAEWLGKDVEELKGINLLKEAILNPLGTKDVLGNITVIREPLVGNDDLSMSMNNEVVCNTAVFKLESTVEKMLKSNSLVIGQVNEKMKSSAQSYLLFSSFGRKIILGDNITQIHKEIKDAVGDKEFIMAFTFGEYGSNEHSSNSCGGLMLSFTGFSE